MSDASDRFNEYAKKHGAKKEVWDENLKFKFQNKSLREYRASIYDFPYRDFPVPCFTSEAAYLQWCVQVAGMMPATRGPKNFREFIRERLAEAEEEEILPNMEEGVEVGKVVLTILKNKVKSARNFDLPPPKGCEDLGDELGPGEWLFLDTAEDSKCGQEVFIKFEGLMACVLDFVAMGSTETKMPRKTKTLVMR